MSIRIEALKVVFRGRRGEPVPVLDVPRFAVEQGQQVCLVGGSGSGKTTFLNTIAGIVLPTAGRIYHDGTEITGLGESRRDRFRATHIGYVFQTFNLLQGLSALENLQVAQSLGGFHGRPARLRAEGLLERVGLAHRRDARPGTLSVGEQQRVAIARAVVNRPRVVLADEPTANLDEENTEEVLSLLRETAAAERSVLLLVTHERTVQERFEQVIGMKEISP